ncbi:MAG: type II secretion system protein GspN [Leptospirales bacterium]
MTLAELKMRIVSRMRNLIPGKRPPQTGGNESTDSVLRSGRTIRHMAPTLFLGLWGVGLFVWFFLHGFPRQQLAEHFLEELSQTSGLGTSSDSARFNWPARISYEGLHLVAPSPAGPVVWEIPRFSGNLSLISLASGKPRYNFDVKAYGGEFRGRLQQARHGRWNHLRGKTIHPIDLLETKKLLRQDVSGKMNLQTDYTWIRGAEQKGHGMLNLDIQKLVLRSLNLNGIPLPDITFETVSGRLFLHDGQGRIESLSADGPLAHVSGTGTILLRIPYQQSLINMDLMATLKGQLKAIPLPSMEPRKDGALHIHLQGILSSPSIALNGLTLPR